MDAPFSGLSLPCVVVVHENERVLRRPALEHSQKPKVVGDKPHGDQGLQRSSKGLGDVLGSAASPVEKPVEDLPHHLVLWFERACKEEDAVGSPGAVRTRLVKAVLRVP